MGFPSILSYAQQIVKEHVQPRDRVIDATMGTGVDTLFLTRLVGPYGKVAAFDIQTMAVERTRQRLLSALGVEGSAQTCLHLASHVDMYSLLSPTWRGTTAAVMFNLGYLPLADADKRMITTPSTTIVALQVALKLLRPRGVLTIVLYPGHAGGACEADAVYTWAERLPATLGQTLLYRKLQSPNSPYLIAVAKSRFVPED